MAIGNVAAPLTMERTETRVDVWHPKRGTNWGTIARHVVLAVFAFIVLFPIAWVLILSIKSIPDSVQSHIWPKYGWDFGHYSYSWRKIPTLKQNFLNSIILTSGTIVSTTICSVLGGYALVHLKLPGRRVVLALLVASMFFPTRVTGIIAIYQIQDSLGLINKTWGLLFPYSTLALAVCVFIMRGMFETIPRDIPDSARIDGASSFRMLLGIMIPMVRNGIVVVVIVSFVAAWGEFLYALTLVNDGAHRTIPVVLATASGGMGAWVWPRLAAVYVMVVTPGLIAFSIAQRWYMKGLQEGALKT